MDYLTQKRDIVKINKELDDKFEELHKLMIESDYGGKEVHWHDGWKIKAWIPKKDLEKIRRSELS